MNKILYGFPFYMYNPSTCIQYQVELRTTLNGFLKELNWEVETNLVRSSQEVTNEIADESNAGITCDD